MFLSTQGLSSLTSSELSSLSELRSDGSPDDATLLNDIISDASDAVGVKLYVVTKIITSGASVLGGGSDNTSIVASQSEAAYSLALGYAVTGSSAELSAAKNIILGWAKVNIATGDPIANSNLLQMFQAYDMLRSNFSSSEQATIDHWMTNIANAVMTTADANVKSGTMEATNNHETYALLEVATIGAVLDNATFINYATSRYLSQVAENLGGTYADEPANLGVDYYDRHAIHYVALNLQAFEQLAVLVDRLGNLNGNPYHINYNPFTVTENGGSVEKTLEALLPYATGAKVSTTEFVGSHDSDDVLRLKDGSLHSTFNKVETLPSLEEASFFTSTVTSSSGTNYHLAQIASSLTNPLTTSIPTVNFLVNSLEASDTHQPAVVASVTTINGTNSQNSLVAGSGDYIINAGSGNVNLHAGMGNDTLTGGSGHDHFYFSVGALQDVITNFSLTNDMVYLSNQIYTSPTNILKHVTYSDGNAVIHLEGTATVTLTGISSGLAANDFHTFSGTGL